MRTWPVDPKAPAGDKPQDAYIYTEDSVYIYKSCRYCASVDGLHFYFCPLGEEAWSECRKTDYQQAQYYGRRESKCSQ